MMAYQQWHAERSGRRPLRQAAAVLLLAGCCDLGVACSPLGGPPNKDPATAQKPPGVQAKLPPNFPADIPLMPGFSLAGTPQSDSARGTGQATFSGTAKRDAVVAFFHKGMIDEDWSEDESRATDGQWLMAFTKGRLKATISVTAAGATCLVTILYETQQ